MAGTIYTVSFASTAFTNANGDYDFFEITPADDRPIELVGLDICCSNTADAGDAQEEFLQWSIVTDNASSGNGTSTTPRPVNQRSAAAGFTAETVGSTTASTGTEIFIHQGAFNSRVGLQIWWPPEARPRADQGGDTMLCVRLEAAVADDSAFAGTVYVNEL